MKLRYVTLVAVLSSFHSLAAVTDTAATKTTPLPLGDVRSMDSSALEEFVKGENWLGTSSQELSATASDLNQAGGSRDSSDELDPWIKEGAAELIQLPSGIPDETFLHLSKFSKLRYLDIYDLHTQAIPLESLYIEAGLWPLLGVFGYEYFNESAEGSGSNQSIVNQSHGDAELSLGLGIGIGICFLSAADIELNKIRLRRSISEDLRKNINSKESLNLKIRPILMGSELGASKSGTQAVGPGLGISLKF